MTCAFRIRHHRHRQSLPRLHHSPCRLPRPRHTAIPWHLLRRRYITSHHITSHHITSHHITSHHITSHHITSHHITSHHTTSHHITSHHITSHHITSHRITSHHITSLQVDVLESEQSLMAEAVAVLGAADDTHCSYPLVRTHRFRSMKAIDHNVRDTCPGSRCMRVSRAALATACVWHARCRAMHSTH